MKAVHKMSMLIGIAAAMGGDSFMQPLDNDYETRVWRSPAKSSYRGSTLQGKALKKRYKRNKMASASRRKNR